MEGTNSIAHEISAIEKDVLRFGLHGVKSEIVGSHPLQSLCDSQRKREAAMQRKMLETTYGSAFPLKMELDTQILSRFQRPPGAFPSSMLGLEALSGSLDDFGSEDYLNDPCEAESYRPADIHHGMEVHLGLSKGPVCLSFI